MKKMKEIYLKKNKFFLFLIFILALFLIFSQSEFLVMADEEIEKKIEKLRDEEKSLKKELEKAEKTYGVLSRQYQQIQSSMNVIQSEINKISGHIDETKEQISRKESSIKEIEMRLDFQKMILSNLMREMYYTKKNSIFVVLIENNFLATLMEVDNISILKKNIFSLMDNIKEDKEKLKNEKENLSKIKMEKEKILTIKQNQKDDLVSDKKETLDDINEQQKIIDRLKKELSELQSDLLAVTGKSYDAKDIKEAVEFASKKTGVPKGFLIGVLKMESNLGANVGRCTYPQIEKDAYARGLISDSKKASSKVKNRTATFKKRKAIFEDIVENLGYKYNDKPVSCNPRGYTGTGGAMGAAQFMSDTWKSYESEIASLTGNKNPDPWNLTDSVVAMALKLRKTPGVTAGKESAMRSAACSYLGTCYKPYIDGIIYWTDNYKKLL